MIYLILIVALLGVCGFLVYFYNRINATGLPRLLIKLLDKGMLLIGLMITAVAVFELVDLKLSAVDHTATAFLQSISLLTRAWGIFGILSFLVLFPSWLVNRPVFKRSVLVCEKHVEIVYTADLLGEKPVLRRRGKIMSKISGNQIFDLAVERKTLPIHGLPHQLDGLKIAHLSDLHFTGQVGPEFHTLAADFAARWKPDLAVLTGDLIDNPACIPWLGQALRPLACPFGHYFLLGNHDKKVSDPNIIRLEMQRLGWIDLAGRTITISLEHGVVELMGSEVPWFGTNPSVNTSSNVFRIFLSHSPDQIAWARSHGVGLMLAGHTHGGQGRLPLIGPVLSPSKYGSRFASGEFYLEPTTLHVTRGVSGAHLLRINCRPEVSLLTLKAKQ